MTTDYTDLGLKLFTSVRCLDFSDIFEEDDVPSVEGVRDYASVLKSLNKWNESSDEDNATVVAAWLEKKGINNLEQAVSLIEDKRYTNRNNKESLLALLFHVVAPEDHAVFEHLKEESVTKETVRGELAAFLKRSYWTEHNLQVAIRKAEKEGSASEELLSQKRDFPDPLEFRYEVGDLSLIE